MFFALQHKGMMGQKLPSFDSVLAGDAGARPPRYVTKANARRRSNSGSNTRGGRGGQAPALRFKKRVDRDIHPDARALQIIGDANFFVVEGFVVPLGDTPFAVALLKDEKVIALGEPAGISPFQ